MLRNLSYAGLATIALAGCAATSVPYPRPTPTPYAQPRPPSGPNIYTTAPRAPLQSELFACGSWGSNIGPIGDRRQSLLYTPYIETPAGELLRDPTESACLSSGFGWRSIAEQGGNGRDHTGIDLANANGGFVYAAGDGWISSAAYRGGYGLTLEIDHGHGVRTLYGHLNEIDPNLSVGAFVAAGTPVARMGATGNATGIHLHYEVSIDGLKVDPLSYGSPYRAPLPPVVAVGQRPMQPVEAAPVAEPESEPAQSDDNVPSWMREDDPAPQSTDDAASSNAPSWMRDDPKR